MLMMNPCMISYYLSTHVFFFFFFFTSNNNKTANDDEFIFVNNITVLLFVCFNITIIYVFLSVCLCVFVVDLNVVKGYNKLSNADSTVYLDFQFSLYSWPGLSNNTQVWEPMIYLSLGIPLIRTQHLIS